MDRSGNSIDRKYISGFLGLWGGENGERLLNGTCFLLGDEMPWNWAEVLVAEHCECAKCHGTVHLKMVNLMLREFHLSK